MKPFMLSKLQYWINRVLALDAQTPEKMAKLKNKVLMINIKGLELQCQLIFSDREIVFKTEHFLQADTTLQGTPLSLLQVVLNKKNRKQLFVDSIIVEGDLEFAQDVTDLFDELEIDWEEWLSRWIGDVPAYRSGQLLRGVKQWGERLHHSLQKQMSEYLHEEMRWFPAREELNDFFSDVDVLRMDVDRLAARITLLQDNV